MDLVHEHGIGSFRKIETEGEPADCVEAARMRKMPLGDLLKAVLLVDRHKKYFLVCIPADRKVDLKGKLPKILLSQRLSFAAPEKVLEKTKCVPGAVFPFAEGIPLVYDISVLEKNVMNISAGDRRVSYNVPVRELREKFDPFLADILAEA